jgi:hypothetical protein
VRRHGLEVGVAKGPEYSNMIVLWWLVVESSEGDVIVDGGAGVPVKHITCGN